jgi:hypothetical protein
VLFRHGLLCRVLVSCSSANPAAWIPLVLGKHRPSCPPAQDGMGQLAPTCPLWPFFQLIWTGPTLTWWRAWSVRLQIVKKLAPKLSVTISVLNAKFCENLPVLFASKTQKILCIKHSTNSHPQRLFPHAESSAKNAQHAHSACFAAGRLIFNIFYDGYRQKLFAAGWVIGKNYFRQTESSAKNFPKLSHIISKVLRRWQKICLRAECSIKKYTFIFIFKRS